MAARAEVAAEEYMKAVATLKESLLRLVGIGSLLKELPEGRDIFLTGNWRQFAVPGFDLKVVQGAMADDGRGVIPCFDLQANWMAEAGQEERNKIQALGIRI